MHVSACAEGNRQRYGSMADVNARSLRDSIPSAATNPHGPYLPKEVTEHRPTLHSEFQKLRLEAALDAALSEVKEGKNKSK
eukprot:347947-Chlamydomonas_euryale.AAC.14